MSWSKLSDDFADDCWTLSDAAFRTHVEGICYSNKRLLDCIIPADQVRLFAKHEEAVVELVESNWWAVDGDCYVIVHHAAYQRKREDVVAQQAANKANGAKGGRRRKHSSLERASGGRPDALEATDSLSESLAEGGTERDGTGRGRHLGGDVVGGDQLCDCGGAHEPHSPAREPWCKRNDPWQP